MKGILQYSDADSGTYKEVGTVRPKRGQDVQIKPITIVNPRLDEKEDTAYRVQVTAVSHNLNTDFLDEDLWYFRIVYPDEGKMIKLGERRYSKKYNSLIQRHGIVYFTVTLDFTIDYDSFDTYTTPVNLPASEGGIVVDDSSIYIE